MDTMAVFNRHAKIADRQDLVDNVQAHDRAMMRYQQFYNRKPQTAFEVELFAAMAVQGKHHEPV